MSATDADDGRGPGRAAVVAAGGLRVNRSLAVPVEELRYRYSTAGGPGGQHANRSRTAVEVSFEIASSASLGPWQRARLLHELGPLVTARAGEERSQLQNRQRAEARLAAKLASALTPVRHRVPTRPGPAADRRRLEAKRHRGQLKRQRRGDFE